MKPFSWFRLFHWLFVLVLAAVYLSGDDGELLHIWLGYSLVVLVAVRLLLALVRVKGFPALWPAFRSGAAFIAVSRLLVIALFLSASATLTTGLLMVDHSRVLGLAAAQAITPAYADDDGTAGFGDEAGQFSSEIEDSHEIAANTTLVIAVLHIGFLLAFRRRIAVNMIPGFGAVAKSRSGPAAKAGWPPFPAP